MNLKYNLLSGRGVTEKVMYCLIPLIDILEKARPREENRLVSSRSELLRERCDHRDSVGGLFRWEGETEFFCILCCLKDSMHFGNT